MQKLHKFKKKVKLLKVQALKALHLQQKKQNLLQIRSLQKYIQEYRDGELVQGVMAEIRRTITHPWVIMEICGGQTHAIMRYGLDQLLPKEIELVHGPGCPVCVIPMGRQDDAISIANDTPYGLAAYVQTGDHQKALYVAKRLRAGSVYLNGVGQDYSSPFGGFKQSGFGRDLSMHALDKFTGLKTTWIKYD